MKKVLEDKKKQLVDNIKNNLEPQISHTVSFVDPLDFAANESNKNVLAELKAKDLITIKRIDKALAKFSNSTFGVCESCDDDIESKRLNAQPWATLCLTCQERTDGVKRRYSSSKPNPIVMADEYREDDENEAAG